MSGVGAVPWWTAPFIPFLAQTGYRLLYLWVVRVEKQWSQVTTLDKSPFEFKDNITKNEHSALFFLIYVQAVFQKGNLETAEGHMEN